MNVTQFPELISEMLGQNNHDKVDDRVVLAMGDSFRGQLLDEMFASSGGLTGEYVKEFVVDMHVGIGQRKYIVLPCDLCPIRNNGAYRYVGPDDPEAESGYMPINPGTAQVIANLEIGGGAGKPQFSQIGDKVYFRLLPPAYPDKILLRVVPSMVWLYEFAKDTELIGDATVEAKLIKMCYDALVPKATVQEDKDNSNKTTP